MNDQPKETNDPPGGAIISWIMIALLIWGILLAAGAALFGYNPHERIITFSFHPLRGLIVFGCVLSFIAFWAIVLRSRSRQ